jgi:hypothetical protein
VKNEDSSNFYTPQKCDLRHENRAFSKEFAFDIDFAALALYIRSVEETTRSELNMRLSGKVSYWWLAILTVFAASILLLPHNGVSLAGVLSYSMQALLFVICVYIVRYEPIRKNKFIFVNFAVLFAFSFLDHLYSFVGTGGEFFSNQTFLRFFLGQYVFFGAYYLTMAFVVIYLTVDVLFRDFRVYQKYVVSLGIALMFFGFYYAPYFDDPKHLYHTADVLDYKTLVASYDGWVNEVGEAPSPGTLAEITEMYSWKNGVKTGVLFPEEKLERANALYAYLPDNWLLLLLKPLYFDALRMAVVCIGFILLFFGYLYMKDPPQGAYIEKIMFLLLVFCSLEVLHLWTAMKEVEWSASRSIWTVGLYLSDVVLLLLVGAFSMRLRFITSVKGEFYEQELAISPSAVTRWRDSLDNLVVEKFFNRKLILGRMFVSPNRRQ